MLSRPMVLLFLALAALAEPPSEITLFEPGTLSTGAFEYNASFAPDGRTLYFSVAAPRLAAKLFAAIVASHWRDGRWTTPEVAVTSGSATSHRRAR
jgi:hypothetical protein